MGMILRSMIVSIAAPKNLWKSEVSSALESYLHGSMYTYNKLSAFPTRFPNKVSFPKADTISDKRSNVYEVDLSRQDGRPPCGEVHNVIQSNKLRNRYLGNVQHLFYRYHINNRRVSY